MPHDFETADYTARLLPEIGSKLASFRSKRTGFEYLWQPPDGEYPRPRYGAVYGPEFATGFDECFPTLLVCDYPGVLPDGRRVAVPDHGEVWALPWQCRAAGGGLALSVEGKALPYRLEKTVAPEGEAALGFRYRLTNAGDAPLRWLWSAHPLFNATRDLVVAVPGRPAMCVYESLADVLGAPGRVSRWPDAGGIDVSLPGRREPAAEKVFLFGLSEGRVSLRYPETGEGMAIEFSADILRGIGLWYNVRGWPVPAPHYNVGVEPCSEPYESLADSGNLLAPGASVDWWMRWSLFSWAADRRSER
jgi:hypothetical protein